jgi:hypothetical protein
MDSLSNSVDLADADTTTSPKVLGGTNGLWQFRALDGAGTYTYDPVAKAPKVPTGSGKYPTKESFLSGLWDLQGQESWQYSKSHTSADKVAVINAIRDFAKSPAILQANAALKYVTGALPGTPDPASTGLVMTAKYLGGKMCAPYNHQ